MSYVWCIVGCIVYFILAVLFLWAIIEFVTFVLWYHDHRKGKF